MFNELNLFENEKLKVTTYYSITKIIHKILNTYGIAYSSDNILNVLSKDDFTIYATMPMFYDFNKVFDILSNELNTFNVKITRKNLKIPFNVNYISTALTFKIEDIDLVAGCLKLKRLIINPKIFA